MNFLFNRGPTGNATGAKGDTVGADVLFRHNSTKIHALRGKYARTWAITPTHVHHIDPADFKITNSWGWAEVIDFAPTVSSTTEFSFTVKQGNKNEILKFQCDSRGALLCDLARGKESDQPGRKFVAVKITRAGTRSECALEVTGWGVSVVGGDGRKLSTYPFKDMFRVCPVRDDASAVVIHLHGRGRLFAMPERAEFIRLVGVALTRLGLASVLVESGISGGEYRQERMQHGNDGVPRVGEYDVLKPSPKYSTARPRKLVITELGFAERDSATYAVVSYRPLKDIFGLVRHWDDPGKFTVEYKDGTSRSYMSSSRDAILGTLVDCARNVGNDSVPVNPDPTRLGERCLPFSQDEDATNEGSYITNVTRFLRVNNPAAASGPYNVGLVRACAEFNQNVSISGVAYPTRKGTVQPILLDLFQQLSVLLTMEDIPSSAVITLINTATRLVAAQAGYKSALSMSEVVPVLLSGIRHSDHGIVYASFELLRRICRNPRKPQAQDEDAEALAKKTVLTPDMRVAIIQALDAHSASGSVAGNEGSLAVQSIASCLDSILVSHVDTTEAEVGDHLMQLVATRYSALLSLFRCKSPGIVESSAMLMKSIVDQADLDTMRAMQAAALSSGVWLRHFYNACFASSQDQRFVSRYLVELWSTGNGVARELLRHMLPAGLLMYLDSPKLKPEEAAHLHAIETQGAGAGDKSTNKASLATRLRSRLEMAEKSAANRVRRRLTALDENAAGAKKGFKQQMRELGLVGADKEKAATAAAAAAAAIAAQAAMVKAKMEEGGKEENYPLFFFQMNRDHVLPDLIWSQQTRGELRNALEAELREIEREIELGGTSGVPMSAAAVANKVKESAVASAPVAAPASSVGTPTAAGGEGSGTRSRAGSQVAATASAAAPTGTASNTTVITGGVDLGLRVAWNFAEFEVEYPSLVQELRVGDYYLRLFLEAGDASVATLREPGRFFDALYRRVLRETAPNLKCMCLRGMTRVYEKHSKTIGLFEDTDYVVYLLAQTTHAEIRDRLLLLILALAEHPLNCEKMINPDCLELLVDLLTTAHTTDNELRATSSLKAGPSLMLTDATPGAFGPSSSSTTASSNAGATATDEEAAAEGGAGSSSGTQSTGIAGNPKESMKMWHYRARKADLQPGEKPEKGPYSLQDLQRLGDMKKLGPETLVWAQGMREWVRLDSLRAILWYACSEGQPALTPTARGEAACQLLYKLVMLRPAVDNEGAPVRPVPRAKRVLCGPRTLPHIAQAMLAGSPNLVDNVARLLQELVRFNPKAMVKLYTTGVYFFLLGYNGSNWHDISVLLAMTHMGQSFHTDVASLTAETSLARKSILGPMLPESLLCVLENRGPGRFAEAILSNVDTPEVIWKFSMRSHLLEMIAQHLGDLPARLAANPCTLYDYCPIPPVKYEDLDAELWCSNFYLNNLCDEARFGDWPIADPVGLLRSTLDAWRLEVLKTGDKVVSSDEAFTMLGLQPGADEKEIRKAYRKLAMKFHPDKNPSGRDTFEKIHKAYEALTNVRSAATGANGAAAGGPDPISILLMIRTQCILFSRHGKLLRSYKYAGYPLLIESMSFKAEDQLGVDRLSHLEAATRLVYLTCLATAKNAEELVREGGCEALMYLLARIGKSCTSAHPPLSADSGEMRVLDNIMHTLSGMSALKEARERLAANPAFPALVVNCLTLPHSAKIMQHSIDCISRLAAESRFQESLVAAGVIYRLFPLLFRYDATYEQAEAAGAAAAAAAAGGASTPTLSGKGRDSGTHTDNEQKSANQQAKLCVKALARLGGYLDGDQATPVNFTVRRCMAALMTPALSKRLTRAVAGPEHLLKTLNGHEETPTVIWTAGMRKELMGFLAAAIDHLQRTGQANMEPAMSFAYAALKEELRLAGMYVRLFISEPGVVPDDAFGLIVALLQHVAFSRAGGTLPVPEPVSSKASKLWQEGLEAAPYNFEAASLDVAKRHLRLALRAIHLVTVNIAGVEGVIAKEGAVYLPPIFALLEKEANSNEADADAGSELAHATVQNPSKGAAGSGASAGAGGARSTPAPPTAGMRELILTAIAAFVGNEQCATAIAKLHLVPSLIRQLPLHSAAYGPILRTLFSHSVVIAEVARIGGVVDLAHIFAGGPPQGPPPKAGQKVAGPQATMPKAARAAAAALLSALASEGQYGPALLMNLTQLMPEALAVAVKESVSGASAAGAGASGSLGMGAGVGAAGAGGGSGSMGDVVTIFDTDHETPELIWNAVSRYELRAALTELTNGLAGFRKRAQASGNAGGADGCPWSLPATFRVRYSTAEGELRVGGVYLRLFLKEPTFPLRDSKSFLEALLRRFMQESEHLAGMTSEDAEKVRAAQAAAAEAAKAEEAAGGIGMKTRKEDVPADAQLVVRGEDVLTQLTHAIVCLLRVRSVLCDTAAGMGYVGKLVQVLGTSVGKPARYNMGVQSCRVLQVLAANRTCVQAMSKSNAMSIIMRALGPPLPRDAAFILEVSKLALETDSAGADHALVLQAIQCNALQVMLGILEGAKLDHLVDPSAAKVHAVAITKILENDAVHGAQAQALLESQHKEKWERYKHQKHDLFLSRNDTRDYFLTDVSSAAPAFMLKNEAEWSAAPAPAAATSAVPSSSLPSYMMSPSAAPSAFVPPPVASPAPSALPTLYSADMTAPPPAPDALPEKSFTLGGFQAPAPAPAPAPASILLGPAPIILGAPVAAPAPAVDIFAGLAAVPVSAPAPAPADDPFGLGLLAAPAPAPKPAGGAPVDPFADLLG